MLNIALVVLFSSLIIIVFKLFNRFKIDNFQAKTINYLVASMLGILIAGSQFKHELIIEKVDFNIASRTGLQCAPKVHEGIGTKDMHGTCRLSVGPFNTEEHIDAAIEAVKDIASIRK